MNTITKYFESPTKGINLKEQINESNDTEKVTSNMKNNNLESDEDLCKRNIKTKNQEIVKNMEEVLNLVKQKSKSKHKYENGKKSKHHKHRKNKSEDNNGSGAQKSPLKENRTNSRKKSKKYNKNPTKTLQDLLSPSKKEVHHSEIDNLEISDSNNEPVDCPAGPLVKSIELNGTLNDCANSDQNIFFPNATPKKEQSFGEKKTVNAFEFLMNARNKSMGGNSPGKEEIDSNNTETAKKRVQNMKRKLMLEEWADRKGAKKRRLEEAVREQYIEETMDKRALRLKEMIEKQSNPNSGAKKFKEKKIQLNKNETKVAKLSKKSEITELSENKDEKIEKKVRRSIRNSRKLVEINTDISTEQDFTKNLSSPIKKRDSLYGYFEKTTPSPTEVSTNQSVKEQKLSDVKKQVENLNNCENVNSVKLHINLETASKKKETRGRKKKVVNEEEQVSKSKQSLSNKAKNETLNTTPIISERPRRSCVGKTRYDANDYDLGSSSEKNKTRKKAKCIEDESEEVIILDSEISPISHNKNKEEELGQPKKLAPLFIKTIPKFNVDPERIKARQDFLMSGIPEKMKIDIAKMKQFEQNYEAYNYFFPKFNHVPSWVLDDTPKLINWEGLKIFFRKDENGDGENSYFHLKSRSSDRNTNTKNILAIREKVSPLNPLFTLKSLENKRVLVKEWKNLYDKFPTYKCYNQLREKYRYFSAMDTAVNTHQVTESFVVSTGRVRELLKLDSDLQKDVFVLDNIKPPSFAPNGELLFCDKYKPLVSEQILVNLTPVNQLKEFLSNWQCKSKNIPSEEIMDCSFECMNDSNSISELPNCIVLVGPTSSGKTNAVYALANELNFNVLEINAGMKRSGKKLLQDLQEATQSHQIRKVSKNSGSLLKRSLSGLTKSKETLVNEDSLSSELDNNTKTSLILVEDADILFENYDQGFVEAIYQLVGVSKRPVVVLANDKNCSHLQRLISQNCIEFSKPHGVNISKFLTILSLMENCPIHLDDIISLYYYNKMDLRKTISEMQFFIQSGGDREIHEKYSEDNVKSPIKTYFASPIKNDIEVENTPNLVKQEDDLKDDISAVDKTIKKTFEPNNFYIHKQLFEFFTVSQNISYKIPSPINFDLLWININEVFKVSNILNVDSLHNFAEKENESFIRNDEGMKKLIDFYNNISLASNINTYHTNSGLTNSVENEISHYLVEESVTFLMQNEELSYNLFNERPKVVENIVSCISPAVNQRNRRSIALDFEPMLRSICRSEKAKSSQKRTGSRYYHYLRNISFNMNSFSLQLFDDVCPIFVDDPENLIEHKQLEHISHDWLD